MRTRLSRAENVLDGVVRDAAASDWVLAHPSTVAGAHYQDLVRREHRALCALFVIGPERTVGSFP
jgi:hypothetical protein